MPNTKHLKPATRKATKRRGRRQLKDFVASMTREERKAFKKEEKLSLKAFVTKHRADKEQAQADAAKKAAEEAAAKAAAPAENAAEAPAE